MFSTRTTRSNPNPVTAQSAPALSAPTKTGKRKAAAGKKRRTKAPKVKDPAPERLDQPPTEEVSAQATNDELVPMDAEGSAVQVPATEPTETPSTQATGDEPVPMDDETSSAQATGVEPVTEPTTSQLEAVKETANTALNQVNALAQQVDELKGHQAPTNPTATRPKVPNQSNVVTESPAAAEETKRVEPPSLSVQEQVHVEAWKNKHPESGLPILVSRLETLRTVGPRGLPTSRGQLLGFQELGEMYEMLRNDEPVSTSIRRKAQNCLTWYPKLFGNSTKRAINEAAYKLLLEAEWVTEITEVIDEIRKVIARLKAQESAVADAAAEADRKAEQEAERAAKREALKAERKAAQQARRDELNLRKAPIKTKLTAVITALSDVYVKQLRVAFDAKETPAGIEQIGIAIKNIAIEVTRIVEVINSAAQIYSHEKVDDSKAAPHGMTKLGCYQLWPRYLKQIIDLLETHLTEKQLETLKEKVFPPAVPMTVTVPVKQEVTGLYTPTRFEGVTPYEMLLVHLRSWAESSHESLAKGNETKAARKREAAEIQDVPDNTDDEDDEPMSTEAKDVPADISGEGEGEGDDDDDDGDKPIIEMVNANKKAKSDASAAAPAAQPQGETFTDLPPLSPGLARLVDQELDNVPSLPSLDTEAVTNLLAAKQTDVAHQAGYVPPSSGKSGLTLAQITECSRGKTVSPGKTGSEWEKKRKALWKKKMKARANANKGESDSDSDSDGMKE